MSCRHRRGCNTFRSCGGKPFRPPFEILGDIYETRTSYLSDFADRGGRPPGLAGPHQRRGPRAGHGARAPVGGPAPRAGRARGRAPLFPGLPRRGHGRHRRQRRIHLHRFHPAAPAPDHRHRRVLDQYRPSPARRHQCRGHGGERQHRARRAACGHRKGRLPLAACAQAGRGHGGVRDHPAARRLHRPLRAGGAGRGRRAGTAGVQKAPRGHHPQRHRDRAPHRGPRRRPVRGPLPAGVQLLHLFGHRAGGRRRGLHPAHRA